MVRICSIEIDRCTRCRGIWFDHQEQSRVKSAPGSHRADIGHQAIGEYYNAIREIRCPRCNVSMEKEEVKRGRMPIQIESCPRCHGSYFDAGEFRDFAEPTIVEFAKDLIARIIERNAGSDD
ncbi:MAG: zf-TFIIB domain-containing protein [Desulfobulbaceae bacterium]|nr:zf-TFIIB domain-containing protein [Desulfobulbaceae bacterium]